MEENKIPTLTLEPAAAMPEAPVANFGAATATAPAPEAKKEVEPVVVDESMLTEAEKADRNAYTGTNQAFMISVGYQIPINRSYRVKAIVVFNEHITLQ
jgi:hypothetical protein